MSERRLARIQENGQVTLPAESRNRRGVKKGDLVEITETDEGWVIAPRKVVAAGAHEAGVTDAADLPGRRLTDEEVQRGLAALERARRSTQEQLARRGGVPYSSSVDLINEVRQEMTDRL